MAVVVVVAAMILLVYALSRPHTQTAPQSSAGTYVALGDSVAAGYGAGSIKEYDYCERTDQAYPQVVASKLHLDITSFACTRAQLEGGVLNSQKAEGQQKLPQIQQLFEQPQPKLITLTTGVNDLGWTAIIGRCYAGTCGSAEDTAQLQSKIASMKTNLSRTLDQISSHYKTNTPKIIVTGYYQFFNPNQQQSCTDMAGVDQAEIDWWRGQEKAVNAAIEQAVTASKVAKFANSNFDGHELCSSDSWVQSLQSSSAFHPTQTGQAQIANSILRTYATY